MRIFGNESFLVVSIVLNWYVLFEEFGIIMEKLWGILVEFDINVLMYIFFIDVFEEIIMLLLFMFFNFFVEINIKVMILFVI